MLWTQQRTLPIDRKQRTDFFPPHRPPQGFGLSETDSNVVFKAHWLYSPNFRTLQRSNDDWFLVFTPQSLGEIQSVHMWHDNYGPHPDWYCTRVLVTEIRRRKCWAFDVNRWFSFYRPDERIEHTVSYVTSAARDWMKKTREYVGMGIREKHTWASVIIR